MIEDDAQTISQQVYLGLAEEIVGRLGFADTPLNIARLAKLLSDFEKTAYAEKTTAK
ncbi:MAG: hypothetical protein K0U12_07060 [Gammaproteobacteria bacterium]|nr:hypothetical protein [Gammaproteobacteria bacterium]